MAEIIERDLKTRYWRTNEYRCVNNYEVNDDETGGGRDITREFWKYYSKNPNKTKKEEKKAINDAIDSVKKLLQMES